MNRPSPAARGAASPPGLILFSLWLMVFVASSQVMLIAPLLPRIGEQLRIPASLLGTLVTADAVMVGIFAFAAGPISDKLGRRAILLVGTGALALALAAHALAFDYPSLLAARALAGMAGGVLSGAAMAYVGDYFPYERRGWAAGWVMSGIAAGQIVGVPLGAVLAAERGFRLPFLALGAVCALALLLIWRAVPQPDVARFHGRLTVGAALRAYAELVRRREIAAAAAVFFLMFMGNAFFITYLPTWLESSVGATPQQVAALFLVGGIANVLSGPRAGKLSDRIGRKRLIVGASLGLAVLMVLTVPLVRGVWAAYPLFFVAMILFAARIGPFQALLTALVQAERRGVLMSLTMGTGQIGFGIGSAASGVLYEAAGFGASTVAGAVLLVAMAILTWRALPEPELAGAAPVPPVPEPVG
ncbi:MAG TPA: MFS transporter [Longimicrobiaceae bacterium]|nr:MFS transporter [Longimicrobiaceae bacterium]